MAKQFLECSPLGLAEVMVAAVVTVERADKVKMVRKVETGVQVGLARAANRMVLKVPEEMVEMAAGVVVEVTAETVEMVEMPGISQFSMQPAVRFLIFHLKAQTPWQEEMAEPEATEEMAAVVVLEAQVDKATPLVVVVALAMRAPLGQMAMLGSEAQTVTCNMFQSNERFSVRARSLLAPPFSML